MSYFPNTTIKSQGILSSNIFRSNIFFKKTCCIPMIPEKYFEVTPPGGGTPYIAYIYRYNVGAVVQGTVFKPFGLKQGYIRL